MSRIGGLHRCSRPAGLAPSHLQITFRVVPFHFLFFESRPCLFQIRGDVVGVQTYHAADGGQLNGEVVSAVQIHPPGDGAEADGEVVGAVQIHRAGDGAEAVGEFISKMQNGEMLNSLTTISLDLG